MYKTIVVHVDQSAESARRMDAAVQLAAKYGAHLVGVSMTGLPPSLVPVGGFPGVPPLAAYPIEELQRQADAALDACEAHARRCGIASFERRRIDDEPGQGLALQSRYCDLLVIGKPAAQTGLPRLPSGYTESVLLHSTCPVLLIPPQGFPDLLGRKITVGWNGSANAARAVRSAIGLLRESEEVELLVHNPDNEPELHGALPGTDMAGYLARHGIKVSLTVRTVSITAAEALIAHATRSQSGLIVMGAYGHNRFRELILGGTTRSVLNTAPIPLWMAH